MVSSDLPMIQVHNAYKSYGKQVVLDDLNMTVPGGQIYALIGPSGCGKTSLLNCILGSRQLNFGSIEVNVSRKADIGYMPQDVALFKEFNIQEIFTFYGNMFGIRFEEARRRSSQLVEMLELPRGGCRINDLSGGEQRRVSLAVALIHDPKLLLLDEPTVGLDPLLRKKMWDNLVDAACSGVTVVITTHYIEEARMANTIAMMRGGRLLIEESPETVLKNQNVDTLETAFLQVCQIEAEPSTLLIQEQEKQPMTEARAVTFEKEPLFNWNRFSAQLIKNYIWIKRNTMMICLLLFLPASQSYLFCVTVGPNPTNMTVAVLSDELISNGKMKLCDSSRAVIIRQDFNCTSTLPLTCRFLQHLERSTDVEFYDRESAKAAVEKNEAWAFLHLRSNFSEAIIERIIENPLDQDNSSTLKWMLEESSIDIYMDSSNFVMNQILRNIFTQSYHDFRKDLIQSCGTPERHGSSPLRFMNPVFGTRDQSFADGGLPGFICTFIFFFAALFTAGAIMMEKLTGVLERNMISGLTYLEVVIAHMVVQMLLATIQMAIMLVVFYALYDNPMVGSMNLVVSLLFFVEFVGIAYGFLLTEVFTSDRLVTYALIGATLALFAIAGIIWPLEGSHPFIRFAMWCTPLNPAIGSYKDIVLKGYGLERWHVIAGFVSCTVWTTLMIIASIVTYKVRKTKYQ